MALSGTITFTNPNQDLAAPTGPYDPATYESCIYTLVFKWSASQNKTNLTSTINWTLSIGSTGGTSSWVTSGQYPGAFVYNLDLTVNGSTVISGYSSMSGSSITPLYSGDVLGSGSFTVSHGSPPSNKTFSVVCYAQVLGNSPQWSTGVSSTTKTETVTAPTVISKVAATAANIEENTKITITRYVSSYTHTLTYEFGSLTGTIATKTSNTTVNWTVPTTFYAEIPNATYGTCTITCQTYNGSTLVGSSTATFRASIKGDSCAPTLSPVVVDVNSDTIALTGDANKLIRFESMVEFQSGATARNSATLTTQSVVNGSVTKTDFAIGTIDDVESPDFIFSATDSRGLTTTQTYTAEMVMYVKPTCYQKIRAELEGETGARIYIEVSGNYFNGSFGAVSNTLKYEIKATNPDGTQTDWTELPVNVTYGDDNTYTIDFELTGYGYSSSYEFQSRITDKLNVVQSTVYVVRVLPIFDWDKDDFNFNVPVNISADTLDIHNETVLRHGKTTNNTVLSGSGGHIYLRPGGTNDTSGEVRITAQGDIEITGDIIINGVSLVTALENAGII